MTTDTNQTADDGHIIHLIWNTINLLRGNYRQSTYSNVILPFIVLRRFDCLLDVTKAAVCEKANALHLEIDQMERERILNEICGHPFHNTSPHNFKSLCDDPDNIAANLSHMIKGYNKDIYELFVDHFKIAIQIERLNRSNLLYMVVEQFAMIDLSLDNVSNLAMGRIFDDLIRRFSELSSEMAGEYFTARDVTRLIVNLLFQQDRAVLAQAGITRTLYDPVCGTGGMLSVAEEYLREFNPEADLQVYGQELSNESFAICKADRLIKGHNAKNIYLGNSFTEDHLPNEQFDYLLANPPLGLSWTREKQFIKEEHETLGSNGRFGSGLPRSSDGSLLFVMHMISKFNRTGRPTRMGVLLSSSSLMAGDAGSGESEIRRWIIENDWLEVVVALPNNIFYNTGIATYVWILTNQKSGPRRGKVQLIDATKMADQMPKPLGAKQQKIDSGAIATIVQIYSDFVAREKCRIFDNKDLGYQRIRVERPLRLNFQTTQKRIDHLQTNKQFTRLKPPEKAKILDVLSAMDADKLYHDRATFLADLKQESTVTKRDFELKSKHYKVIWQLLGEKDETANPCFNRKGNWESDCDLREYEDVPLVEDLQLYFEKEIRSEIPDAWFDRDQVRIGYEIPFHRLFSPKPFAKIDHTVRVKSLLLSSNAEPNVYFHLTNKRFYDTDFGHSPNQLPLSLDFDKVDFRYLNHYFSSPEGKEWLSYYSSHNSSNIGRHAFLNAKILLPSLEEQIRIVSLFHELETAQQELQRLESHIWEELDESEVAISNYSNIKTKSLNDFIHHLPYPLATLLNHATNSIDDKEACEAYLNFFEYAAALTLSAVVGELPNTERRRLKPRPQNLSVTMGHYHWALKWLKANRVSSNFHSAFTTFVDQEYIELIGTATDIRNDVAHTGIANRKTIESRRQQLINLVNQFRLLTKDFFYQYTLIRPRHTRCFSDHYVFTVDAFSGLASAPFNKIRIKVEEPLIDKQLYWGAISNHYEPDDLCSCYKASPLLKLLDVNDDIAIEDFYFFAELETFKREGDTAEQEYAKYNCPYWSINERVFIDPSEIKDFYQA